MLNSSHQTTLAAPQWDVTNSSITDTLVTPKEEEVAASEMHFYNWTNAVGGQQQLPITGAAAKRRAKRVRRKERQMAEGIVDNSFSVKKRFRRNTNALTGLCEEMDGIDIDNM